MKDLMQEDLKRFNYLVGEIDSAYHEAALKIGLSDSAMSILYALCCNGEGCMLQDIARLTGLRKQTVNSALRKLEAEGVVCLEALDGRSKRLCLTAKGQELAKRTVVRLIEIENEIFHSWETEERKLFLELNQRYLDTFCEKLKEL